MAVVLETFTPSVTLSETDMIVQTDDKIRTITDEMVQHTQTQTQSAADQLETKVDTKLGEVTSNPNFTYTVEVIDSKFEDIASDKPTISGAIAGVETTKVNITISNYSPTATYNINVSGGVANRVNNIIEWTLPIVDATGSYDLTVSAVEVGKVGSAIATHSVSVTNAVSDQVVLFQNATMSEGYFESIIIADGSTNTSTTDLMPVMNSNSQDGYTISGSSIFDFNRDFFYSFADDPASSNGGWFASDNSMPNGIGSEYIDIKLANPSVVNKIGLAQFYTADTSAPKVFSIKISADNGVTYTTVLNVSKTSNDWIVGVHQYFTYSSSVKITNIRFVITESFGNDYSGFSDIKLIKAQNLADLSNNTIKSLKDNVSIISKKIVQDAGDSDFIMAIPTVEDKANLFLIDAEATNTSVTVSGELAEGDTVLVNDGESTALNKFDTTGKLTLIGTDGADNDSTTDSVPTMSSNTQDGFEVSVKSCHDWNIYAPWYAFNDTNETHGYVASSTTNQYITLKFPTATAINKVSLTASTIVNRMFKDWRIKVSNTGAFSGEEVTLFDTTTTGWGSHEKRFFTFVNSNKYLYYRFEVDNNNGDGNYIEINEIELIEAQIKSTLDLTSLSLNNAPKIIARDTADIETSLVASGSADSFESRNKVSHSIDGIVVYEADGTTNTSTTDATKTHTSASSSTGTVTTSNEDVNFEGWRAFDGVESGNNAWFVSNQNTNQKIRYSFTEKTCINKLLMRSYDNSAGYQGCPAEFNIKASNTGAFSGEEVTLTTETGLVWTQNEEKEFEFANGNEYYHYEITVVSTFNNYSHTAIGELKPIKAEEKNQKITTQFDSDNRQGRDFKVKVNLAKSGDEVSKIEIPISKA